MNFAFDEEQRSLGETVGAVLAEVPALTAPDVSSDGNAAAWQRVAELGLFSLLLPETQGGVGLQLADVALAVEALGAGLAPPIIASTLVATDVLVQHGSAAQQQAWLPRMAAGEVKVAIAIIEPGGDYDARTLKVTAEGGKLSGRKLLVPGGVEADAYLVIGAYAGDASCWLVDASADGITTAAEVSLDPPAELASVTFAGVPADRLTSAGAARRALEVGAIVTAGMTTGIAGKMLAASVDYASTREQFGQPIGAFQAIKHRCADMAVALEAARSAAYYAFWAIGEDVADAGRAASMAKAYCGDVARFVCNESIQIHGGMGFTWELGLHRYLRRTKLFEHQYGDAVFHRERVVAETLRIADGVAQRRDAA